MQRHERRAAPHDSKVRQHPLDAVLRAHHHTQRRRRRGGLRVQSGDEGGEEARAAQYLREGEPSVGGGGAGLARAEARVAVHGKRMRS